MADDDGRNWTRSKQRSLCIRSWLTTSSDLLRKRSIQVESIDGEHDDAPWREVLVEDKHAGPAETAAARIDVGDWFASLSDRDRTIAKALSDGSTTQDVAKRFRLSPGRISQKRREFLESWQTFQSDLDEPAEAALLA